MSQKIKLKKNLNADALFSHVHSDFKKIKDHRSNDIKISLTDALMSGFAMFSLKCPHIRELKKHHMHYILGEKKGDHAFLFDHVESATKGGLTTEIEHQNDDVVQKFRFINQVPLNASNQDLLVNFVEYWETTQKKRCTSVGLRICT